MAKKQQPGARGKGSRGLGHIDAQVGAHLREYRIRAGLSQTDLGAKIGITFQRLERDRDRATTRDLRSSAHLAERSIWFAIVGKTKLGNRRRR